VYLGRHRRRPNHIQAGQPPRRSSRIRELTEAILAVPEAAPEQVTTQTNTTVRNQRRMPGSRGRNGTKGTKG